MRQSERASLSGEEQTCRLLASCCLLWRRRRRRRCSRRRRRGLSADTSVAPTTTGTGLTELKSTHLTHSKRAQILSLACLLALSRYLLANAGLRHTSLHTGADYFHPCIVALPLGRLAGELASSLSLLLPGERLSSSRSRFLAIHSTAAQARAFSPPDPKLTGEF